MLWPSKRTSLKILALRFQKVDHACSIVFTLHTYTVHTHDQSVGRDRKGSGGSVSDDVVAVSIVFTLHTYTYP